MWLGELLAPLPGARLEGDPGVDIASVAYDSRRVQAGALFCCLVGQRTDGHLHAADAVAAGAVALLVERRLDLPVVQAVVPDARHAMGVLAARLAGDPSDELAVVGVTGTNGKTTTTMLLAHVLGHAGRPCAVVGTLTGALTTPESPDLQELLRAEREAGSEAVAMEVSSHALALRRVDGTRFRLAVFTNLGRDHLDFHGTQDAYFEAKARLFTPELAHEGLVNADDAFGRRLLREAAVPCRTFAHGDLREVEVGASSSSFLWRGQRVRLPLGGAFNLTNALAAAEAAHLLGIEAPAVAGALAQAPPVPGRFEAIEEGQPFLALVDYAHTPDGLAAALAECRRLAGPHRVLVVFGCGGDRDASKRPEMGRVASDLADLVVLTSDNPRSEDPVRIIEEIQVGMSHPDAVRVHPDRREAIGVAVEAADPGDVVLVAGKGHETTQTVGPRVLPFDDREVVREALRVRTGSQR